MDLLLSSFVQFLVTVSELISFPVLCFYLLVIIFSGWWQRLSHPLGLRQVMLLYNFLCSALSLYTCVGFCFSIFSYHSLYDRTPSAYLRTMFFAYWISKNVELCDTLFMILRHKRRQISFLHVYHHATMLLLSDYAYHFTPWPTIGVYLGLNSFVHVLLYGYYGLTALRPGSPLSWKRHLTEIQIIQFFIGIFVAVPGYLYHGYCIYSILYAVVMAGLFIHFYMRAYVKKKSA